MTRIAFVADVHLGNHRRFGGPLDAGINTRARYVLDALRASVVHAVNAGADRLVVLGDLFDTTRPPPQLISAALDVFLGESEDLEKGVTILRGNHDMVSDAAGDHALGPLGYDCWVVDSPTLSIQPDHELWLVPFRPGHASEWLPDALAEVAAQRPASEPARDVPRILCFHLGVADAATPPWLQGAHDSIEVDPLRKMMGEHGITFCFCGNWHDRKVWTSQEEQVVQVGALVPTGFDNPGLSYGYVALLDTETGEVEWSECPGPRFLKVSGGPEALSDVLNAAMKIGGKRGMSLWKFYVDWRVPVDQLVEARERFENAKASGLIVGGSVLPDGEQVAATATKAARAARASDTLDEAIDAWLATTDLPEHVEAPAVAARIRKYLGQ